MGGRDERSSVLAIWLLVVYGAVQPLFWSLPRDLTHNPFVYVPNLIAGATLVILAAIATRRLDWLSRTLARNERAHSATLSELEQLRTQNAMLETIAGSVDVPRAFQELALRIERLVPCDRIGLALLSEDGKEFQTYTARAEDGERRPRTRPEVVFRVERTVIGGVVRTREPLIVNDMREVAADHVDANVVLAAGFRSSLIIPLISTDRAVGTLNVVSRRAHAFDRTHIAPLQAIAGLLAVAWVAQQAQMTIARYRTVEAMSEEMLAVSSEINSALQSIVGHCDLLARTRHDAAMERDLDTIVRQTCRIAELLEKMRAGTRQRLREATESMNQTGRA
jgi:transcriptional regulator with GAF, ATPase, and Fis domain